MSDFLPRTRLKTDYVRGILDGLFNQLLWDNQTFKIGTSPEGNAIISNMPGVAFVQREWIIFDINYLPPPLKYLRYNKGLFPNNVEGDRLKGRNDFSTFTRISVDTRFDDESSLNVDIGKYDSTRIMDNYKLVLKWQDEYIKKNLRLIPALLSAIIVGGFIFWILYALQHSGVIYSDLLGNTFRDISSIALALWAGKTTFDLQRPTFGSSVKTMFASSFNNVNDVEKLLKDLDAKRIDPGESGRRFMKFSNIYERTKQTPRDLIADRVAKIQELIRVLKYRRYQTVFTYRQISEYWKDRLYKIPLEKMKPGEGLQIRNRIYFIQEGGPYTVKFRFPPVKVGRLHPSDPQEGGIDILQPNSEILIEGWIGRKKYFLDEIARKERLTHANTNFYNRIDGFKVFYDLDSHKLRYEFNAPPPDDDQ